MDFKSVQNIFKNLNKFNRFQKISKDVLKISSSLNIIWENSKPVDSESDSESVENY